MRTSNRSLLSIVLLITVGCAHRPAVEALPSTAIPADEIIKLENDLNQGLTEQLDVLAPSNYEEAQEALNSAKEDIKDKDDAKGILLNIATAQAYLAKARDFAKISTNNMSEVVEARKLAMQEGAKDAFEAKFREADQDLKSVTRDIEENKTAAAADQRSEILAQYLDLEVQAIRHGALNAIEAKVKAAKKDDAEDWAPQSLTLTEKSIKDADNFITANRHDKAKIKELSDKANADADKLIVINKEARAGTKATGETAALKLYTELGKVATQKVELAAAKDRLDQAEAQNNAASSALASDQAFNRQFEQARAMFNKNEAEVYRQGDNLLIRLKGLEFTNAKATLKGSNFPLLAKVKNVIGAMNADTVIVEGHTDSVGSKTQNEELSHARAEAVKSYFESNSSGEPAQYSAIGYGFQKPLATNKTASGRAQNRRVDVVIHTQASDAG